MDVVALTHARTRYGNTCALELQTLPDPQFFMILISLFSPCFSLQLAMMEAEKARNPMEGLEPVSYPSKEQLLSGQAQEPEQRMGDYVINKSEVETGREFALIKDLGVEGGLPPNSEVRTAAFSTRFRCMRCILTCS